MIISELREVPAFAETIADRAWHAWWTDTDVSLSQYRTAVEQTVDSEGIPIALVAHTGEKYVGSALLVDNDLDARPKLSPWIAALWVEPQMRRRGIAAKLIHTARKKAANWGHNVSLQHLIDRLM